jgi:ABC-type sugar transport system ATPase subunit
MVWSGSASLQAILLGTRMTGDRPVLLETHDLTKRYGAVDALRGVSLDLRRGEVHGLCGHNGAGKSTLVKILIGLTRPDTGLVVVDGEEIVLRSPQHGQALGLALVDQELSVVPTLSVEENLFLGGIDVPFVHRRPALRRRARGLLDRVGLRHVRLRTPVEALAVGERQLLEIARALGRDAKVLILDEPTASLSQAESELVFRVVRELAAQGRTLLYVSHRLDEVLALCDRVTVLRDGRRVATHAVGALDRDKLIHLMLGEMGEIRAEGPSAGRASGVALEVEALSVPRRVVDFAVAAGGGEVVGLAGQIGSGTSEVLRALAGLIPEARGSFRVSGESVTLGSPSKARRAGVLYISNDRQAEGLFLDRRVDENFLATRLEGLAQFGVLPRARLAAVAARLAQLVRVDPKRLRSQVNELSGGNQQKVLVGRCLERAGTRVLLLDDPTRGVDVAGRAEIQQLIRHATREGNVVVVSSTELDEILELADVVVTMFAGSVVSVRERSSAAAATILAEMTMPKQRAVA